MKRIYSLVVITAMAAMAVGFGVHGGVASAAPMAKRLPPLTVAVTSEIPEHGAIYLAQALGYFKHEGLTVNTIDNAGSNGLADLVSGSADLWQYDPIGVILPRSQGQDIKVIYDYENFDGAALLGAPNVGSIGKLRAAPNCRIGTVPPGTSNYYMAVEFSRVLHLHCNYLINATVPVVAASVTSGAAQAAALPYSVALAASSAGEGHLLVNPATKAFQEKYVPRSFPFFTTVGFAATLKAKRGSIIAFLKGMTEALKFIDTHSAAKVVALLRTQQQFRPTPASALLPSQTAADLYFPKGPNWGIISKASWRFALAQYAKFGLPGVGQIIGSNDLGVVGYNAMVDMSYAEAALKGLGRNFAR